MKNTITVDEMFSEIKQSDRRAKANLEIAEKMADIACDLSEARIRKGLSQRELAKLCGMTQSEIARVESLRYIPRLDTLLKIANKLDVCLRVEEVASLPKLSVQYGSENAHSDYYWHNKTELCLG